MKKSELLFNLISIPVDFLMLMIAGIIAFYLRFRLEGLRPVLFSLSVGDYMRVLFLISPVLILLLAFAGLYNLKGTRRRTSELFKIVLAISLGLLLIVILFFFNTQVFPSRLIILLTWILGIVLIGIGRLILRAVQVRLLRRGIGQHRLAVIEPEIKTYGLVKKIEERPELGYRIISKLKSDMPVPEMIEQLEHLRAGSGIDELLQTDPNLDQASSLKLLEFCRNYGIRFNFVPNLFETETTNIAVETVSGIPLIVLKASPLEGWGRVVKRILDVIISAIGLVILSPVFLVTAIAIKINSKGPVFFHQKRAAGLGSFECYKFRSMYYEMSEGTETGDKMRSEIEAQNARQGPFVKIKNDPRVTSIGRFLRKTKLDEMPQLWHILRGQMSLVGPRVHMTKEVDHFRNEYKYIFTIKPGATGLTQITQATDKPEISFEEEIRLDSFYIENWSIGLDLYIIMKTVLILLGRKTKVDY